MTAFALMKRLYICINENMDLRDAGVLGLLYNNTNNWYLVGAIPSISYTVYLTESSWKTCRWAPSIISFILQNWNS